MRNPVTYPQRRSIRLQHYDYTQPGAYFITLCAHQRQCLFGRIEQGVMQVNEYGKIVTEQWLLTENLRENLVLDEWVLMPNHFHGIIFISEGVPRKVERAAKGPPARSIGALVAGFKSAVTTKINTVRNTPGDPVWQRNYWDRVIRDEAELSAMREYIHNNPARWEYDTLHVP